MTLQHLAPDDAAHTDEHHGSEQPTLNLVDCDLARAARADAAVASGLFTSFEQAVYGLISQISRSLAASTQGDAAAVQVRTTCAATMRDLSEGER